MCETMCETMNGKNRLTMRQVGFRGYLSHG